MVLNEAVEKAKNKMKKERVGYRRREETYVGELDITTKSGDNGECT